MPRFGNPHRHYRLTDSTNERARELALAGAPSGTVVTAAEQTAGRGRLGRIWLAPPGKALLYSAILRPLDPEQPLLPLTAPLAVCEAIESLAPVRCLVKWPNDVWIAEDGRAPGGSEDPATASVLSGHGRKVAGILIEARPAEWAVIGIGINVAIAPDEFPADLRWPATSIGHGATVECTAGALNERLSEWVAAEPARMLAAYAERDALRGRQITWEGAARGGRGAGIAEGIDEAGQLIVRAGETTISLGWGEVKLRVG
jgi:BirA family biotin operon repressor/biotin-[acetyl-CoA-carboxylase] ligase